VVWEKGTHELTTVAQKTPINIQVAKQKGAGRRRRRRGRGQPPGRRRNLGGGRGRKAANVPWTSPEGEREAPCLCLPSQPGDIAVL